MPTVELVTSVCYQIAFCVLALVALHFSEQATLYVHVLVYF